jgi:hypothetical protein
MSTKILSAEPPEENNSAYFWRTWKPEFGPKDEDPEGLHLQFKTLRPHYELTSTQYFGFHVPQENVHAFLYLWHHPNLGMVSGGPMVWQGIKESQIACELFDYRAYLSDDALGDFVHYKLDNGYEVEVIDNGRSFHTSYSDSVRDNHYAVTHTPISELLYWPSGRHFEQVMRTKGEVVLRGKRFAVDGFHVRDRSWGEYRTEQPLSRPPIAWTTGVFDEGFSFNATGTDDPTLSPIWKGHFDVKSKETLNFWWIIVDGTPTPIASMRKLTKYNHRLFPQAVSLELIDTRGRKFDINGKLAALSHVHHWPNFASVICLFRWECNGKVGWGDHQEVQGGDFVRLMQPTTGNAN